MDTKHETVAEFLARGGSVTRVTPASTDAPRASLRKASPRKGDADAARAERGEPVFFNVSEYLGHISATAHKVCRGHWNADTIAADAVSHVGERVRDGAFRGGDVKPWLGTVVANFARNELAKENTRTHASVSDTGESDDASPALVVADVASTLRIERTIAVRRIAAIIADMGADVATFAAVRIESGSNNEACAAVGWSAPKGSRTWAEIVERLAEFRDLL